MKTLKSVFLLSSIALSCAANAGIMYDDWDVERVPDQVKETTLYYGQNHCTANVQLFYGMPYQSHDFYINLNKAQAVSEPRPQLTVYAPFTDQFGTELNRPYTCTPIGNFPYRYVKSEVLSYKNNYTPRQPYASYLRYELGGCRVDVREGTVFIGSPAFSASNMKVYISRNETDYADTLIYDGVPVSLIGVDVAAPENHQRRNVRVKYDEGSSAYSSIRPLKCARGEVDQN